MNLHICPLVVPCPHCILVKRAKRPFVSAPSAGCVLHGRTASRQRRQQKLNEWQVTWCSEEVCQTVGAPTQCYIKAEGHVVQDKRSFSACCRAEHNRLFAPVAGSLVFPLQTNRSRVGTESVRDLHQSAIAVFTHSVSKQKPLVLVQHLSSIQP